MVFQCLQDTLSLGPEYWRVLALCHQRRNVAEYEGHLDIEDQLVADLIRVGELVLERVAALGNVRDPSK